MQQQQENKSSAYWAVVVLCVFWGTTWLPSKIGVGYMPPLQLAGTRQLVAGTLFMTYFSFRRMPLPTLRQFGALTVLSFFFLVVSNGLTVWSLKYIPSGVGSIIGAIVPLWIALISVLFMGEKLNRLVAAGLVLGFSGIVLVFFNDLLLLFDPAAKGNNFGAGMVLGIIATLSWSIGTIYTARSAIKLDPFHSLGWQMLISGIILLSTSYGFEETVPLRQIHHHALTAIAYLVIVGSIITFMAYIYALRKLPTAQVAVYAYVNPIIAVLLGWVILGEKVNLFLLAGGAITLLGVYLVNRGFRKG